MREGVVLWGQEDKELGYLAAWILGDMARRSMLLEEGPFFSVSSSSSVALVGCRRGEERPGDHSPPVLQVFIYSTRRSIVSE